MCVVSGKKKEVKRSVSNSFKLECTGKMEKPRINTGKRRRTKERIKYTHTHRYINTNIYNIYIIYIFARHKLGCRIHHEEEIVAVGGGRRG